jgi:hypothetical protein
MHAQEQTFKGCLQADEMGLGKTIQALALILLKRGTCWDPPRNNFRWSTNRPVLYSAGLSDLFTRLYKGQACCPIGQFAIQQAAGEKYVVQPPGWFRVDAAKGVCVTHRTLIIFPTRPIRPPWSLGSIFAASIRVQQSRMGKNWVTTGVKSHSDTLPKRHTSARAR